MEDMTENVAITASFTTKAVVKVKWSESEKGEAEARSRQRNGLEAVNDDM